MIKSIFTNSFGILFSRVFGFLRDMTTASILGVNIYSDIFFVTFQLPNLFRRIFAEGAFLQAFLPSFIHSKKRTLLFASIFSSIFLIILTLTLLVYIFDFQTAKLVFAGFSDEVISKAIIFLKINFLFLPLIFVTTILGAILNFKNHFWISSFSSAFINIGIILALLLSENKTPKEIALFMSFGVLIGAIFQVAIHLIGIKTVKMTKVIFGGFYKLNRISEVKQDTIFFVKKFLLSIWGNSTTQISTFLDTVIASFLISGSISYLYFANRVFQFPLALFAIATSIVLFPKINKLLKLKKLTEAKKIFKYLFLLLFVVLFLASLIGIVFSEDIIKLLFERGNFTALDRIETAKVLEFYLFGLVFSGLSKLLSLWLYAHEKMLETAKISTYTLIVKICFSIILIQPFGVAGLALSTTLSSFVLFIFTILSIKKL